MSAANAPQPLLTGLVIASHGRLCRVRTDMHGELLARPRNRHQLPVCGDRVRLLRDAQHDAVLLDGIEPRLGELYRSDSRGRGELLAANVSLLLVVMAPLPEPDLFIVDRYLSAAACSAIRAMVVVNKCDLPVAAATQAELAAFAACGYTVHRCSTLTGQGIAELRNAMQGTTAMLVGQSGVGKSSLLLRIAPDCGAATGELVRDAEGRHTTTTARLHALDETTALIDSPGVRDFAPAIDRLDSGSLGFVELSRLSGQCRFADCRHLKEPDCAVRAAVDCGQMSARRYEGYRRLRRLHSDLSLPPGQQRR